jgi:enoyl-CoA hydratase
MIDRPRPTDVADRVATVTIHRPEKLNALNREVLDALDAAFVALEARDDVAVVIVTGAGDRAFVAGADIGALVEMSPLRKGAVSQPTGRRSSAASSDFGAR